MSQRIRYKRGRSKRKPIGKKGTIVWDEGANPKFISHVQDVGWEVKRIPSSLRGIGYKDWQVAKDITKGKLPIFTNDHTTYQENTASGYVVQDVIPSGNEALNTYIAKVKKFFDEKNLKEINNRVWKIPYDKEPRLIDGVPLPKKRKFKR